MTIICGIDFSEDSLMAARAAAAIAKRSSVPLKLVHVIGELGAEITVSTEYSSLYDPLRQRLHDLSAETGTQFGIDVEPIVVAGSPYEKLNEISAVKQGGLIVLSALGRQKQHRWLLGSVAERVAQTSRIPVLIVRESSSIESWARGQRPLHVTVGVEIGSASKSALHWANHLRALGTCDLFVAHVAWPFAEHSRLGIPGPMPLDSFRPELETLLRRDLQDWAGELPGGGETKFAVFPGWGRVDSHLALLAAEAQADLLVVGTHQRAASARFWQGSVSRGVLHLASCNVACVPRSDATGDADAIPMFRRLLVPTDFSPAANRAIAVGYGLVAPGGIVHLVYVITRKLHEDEAGVTDRLRSLIPKGAAAKGIVSEIEIVRDEDASTGIWHAAGRLGVDLICMATHGRSGISNVVLGSQAQGVVSRVRQPVVLVPPEREV